ncbi:MAG TPA: aldose epimerase [Trichocoleus sp.]|jgi:galactose mutarotase-like enzyme
MPSIAQEQRQYLTYLLTDDNHQARLEVVPERGGIITRWQVKGQEILYLDESRFADPGLTVRGGIPILFPICGNLPENTYRYQGQNYHLKQHGFARDLPWTVVAQRTQPDVALQLRLTSNEQTRQNYPFEFELLFTYRLEGQSLVIDQQCINRSLEPMPCSIGFHPYFAVRDKSQLQFNIPATRFQNQQNQTIHPFSGQFDFTQDEIDVAFSEVSRSTASATDLDRQIKLSLEYDSLYSTLVFWTIRGKDYYCLEPWSAPRNALNSGEHLTQIAPGDQFTASIKLVVDFL